MNWEELLKRPHPFGPHPSSCGFNRQVASVSADANDTQAKYGNSNAAARALTRQNKPIVTSMRTQSTRISVNANPP